MPRAPKADSNKRHDPLHVQMNADELHAKYGSVSKPGRRKRESREDEEENEVGGERYCWSSLIYSFARKSWILKLHEGFLN